MRRVEEDAKRQQEREEFEARMRAEDERRQAELDKAVSGCSVELLAGYLLKQEINIDIFC